MRRLWIIGFCTVLMGCSLVENGYRTLFCEPWEFCGDANEHHAHARHLRMACDAWRDVQQCNEGQPFSRDYAIGFKDGYTDYLDAGGNGEPPPLPPRTYWTEHYETPEGHQAIQDWFAGFRHGAAVARQSGCRHFATVPSSVPGCPYPAMESVPPPPTEPLTSRTTTTR